MQFLKKFAFLDGSDAFIVEEQKRGNGRTYCIVLCEHGIKSPHRKDCIGRLKQCVCKRDSLPKGKRIGRLVVLSRDRKNRLVTCLCDCGKKTTVNDCNLMTKNTMSCGCLFKEKVGTFNLKHGRSAKGVNCITFSSWASMKARCYIPSSTVYEYYGGRGIGVCDEWRDNFNQFLLDVGERPSLAHSLDRMDCDKNYSKDNCRWATRKEQANNRRPRGSQVKKDKES